MTTRLVALLLGLLFVLPAAADEKKEKADEKLKEALAKSLADADAIFTADLGKVNPLGQTNSIPPNTFGEVTFKDYKELKGTVAEGGKYQYGYKEGVTVNLDLSAKGKVLVAVKGGGVLAIVPATEANLALVKKAAEEKKEK